MMRRANPISLLEPPNSANLVVKAEYICGDSVVYPVVVFGRIYDELCCRT